MLENFYKDKIQLLKKMLVFYGQLILKVALLNYDVLPKIA